MGQGLHDRCRPLQPADGVRGDQHAAPRRSASAHLPHARRRQDVDGDRQRHSSRRTVNAVREDPKKQGLLFAGTERAVYVSFDDGANWQSLRLNMAASSVRDLIVKDDDLVVATHGRGFWILDDITPLRQIDARDRVDAGRVSCSSRRPPGACAGTRAPTCRGRRKNRPAPNPPDGAIINYYLKARRVGPVTLEILRADGRLVRRYSSADPVAPIPDAPQRAGAALLVTAAAGALDGDRACIASSGTCTTSRSAGRAAVAARRLPIQAIPHNSGAGADDAVGQPRAPTP